MTEPHQWVVAGHVWGCEQEGGECRWQSDPVVCGGSTPRSDTIGSRVTVPLTGSLVGPPPLVPWEYSLREGEVVLLEWVVGSGVRRDSGPSTPTL